MSLSVLVCQIGGDGVGPPVGQPRWCRKPQALLSGRTSSRRVAVRTLRV